MLEFRNVYKSFKKKEVLCDVNYKLSAGEKVLMGLENQH